MAKMLRKSTIALTVLALATATAGCSTPQDPAESEEASGSLTLWMGSWWEDQVPKIMERWEADHPEIDLTIETLPINGYLDKFTASSLGGTPPDLIDLDTTWISSLAAQNLLEPLDSYVDDLDVPDFVPADWAASSYEGSLYGIPNRADASVYYYNKTVFDKAGVAYPTDDWTHEDLQRIARDLTIPGQQYGIGLGADVTNPSEVTLSFMPTLWAHGGDLLNADGTKSIINNPEGIEAITYWTDFYVKYGAAPEGTPNFTIVRDVVPLFQANQVGLIAGYSNTFAQLSENPDLQWGTVLPPDDVSYSLGWSFGVPVGAANPAAARTFALWFAEPENLGELMIRIPARFSSLDIAPWNDAKYDIYRGALKIAKAAPSVAGWTEIQVILITALQKVLVKQLTPQEAADSVAAQIDAVIADK